MFEKLVSGDQVMKIPAYIPGFTPAPARSNDIPNGACGIVEESEATLPFIYPEKYSHQTLYGYGCYVIFKNHPNHGKVFFFRQQLMKITPDEKMKEEENAECLKS